MLESVRPVIEGSRHVRTDVGKVVQHARWIAGEELPVPDLTSPLELDLDPPRRIDFVLVATALDFAFTDFETGVPFRVEHGGRSWSDAMALYACMRRALEEGVPFLEGDYLREVSVEDLRGVFRGETPLPMLEERAEILRGVGTTLAERYGGRFHEFVRAGPPRAYHGGEGLVERLVAEFPRFEDVARHGGHEVKFHKLAQLGVWMLHGTVPREAFRLEDPERLTAFPDYILPVALRLMEILRYEPALERAIREGEPIPAGSPEEVEIRAHTVHATALLREEVNRHRPPDRLVIIPQIDARLWTHYHATFHPHHLTRTVMY